jgi:hypothetical protein
MSGGHFEYNQYRLNDIACEIQRIIETHTDKDFWNFKLETIDRFKEAIATLRNAEAMVQRIDWLVSGDDDEESFHKRWKEEIKNDS